MRQCSHCGASLDDDAMFCTECGTKADVSSKSKCPSCSAELDADSVFCTECGTRLERVPTSVPPPTLASTQSTSLQQPVIQQTTAVGESSSELTSDEQEETMSKTTLIAIIIAVAVLLIGVGGYLYYYKVYLPEKIDSEAPRYYTIANAVVLRSSKSSGADYNKIGSLPYGTELITYEQDGEWSKVKVNAPNAEGKKQEGYVASSLTLNKADFFLLNSVFGDTDSKEIVSTTKCRTAVLNYFNENSYIGKIDEQLRMEAGITTNPNDENQWQIFCRPKEMKPNNVFFKRLYDKSSHFTDFAVIIKNISTGQRKLLYFYFDDDETPHFLAEQEAPEEGYIKNIIITGDGYLKVYYGD